MNKLPKPYHGNCNYQGAGIYKHYKGAEYCVMGLAVQEETVDKDRTSEEGDEIHGRIVVVYMPLSPGSLLPRITPMDEGLASAEVTYWTRELSDFNEIVMLDHNHSVRRFEKVIDFENRDHAREPTIV